MVNFKPSVSGLKSGTLKNVSGLKSGTLKSVSGHT